MSATCDTCKFWGDGNDDQDWTASGVGFKRCQAIRERWELQDKASKGLEWDGEGSAYDTARADVLRSAKAYVQDGSEYRADLLTGPDFGCVLHQRN